MSFSLQDFTKSIYQKVIQEVLLSVKTNGSDLKIDDESQKYLKQVSFLPLLLAS